MTRTTRGWKFVLILTSAAVLMSLPAQHFSPVGQAHAAPENGKFDLLEATIPDIHRALRRKEITCVQLVTAYLARIKEYNGTCVDQPEGILGPITPIENAGAINALMTLNLRPATRIALGFDDRKARTLTDPIDASPSMPDALETAAKLDQYLATKHQLIGPLHCVVMAVKDQFDTFDMRTTSGMDAAYADDRPPDDATFVTRLRDAGAIILAKANQGEMAAGNPRSSFGGTLCNPYDTKRSPGHSSGGSATAVSANLVTCSIGEETGGSIGHPSRNAAVVGLVPTQERVSRDGMIDAGMNTRFGPMCRTVEDNARVFDVVQGYDPKDELTVFSFGKDPEKPYYRYAKERRLKGKRIGVIREYMDPTLFNQADLESIAIGNVAIEKLRALGATIVDPGPNGQLFQECVDQYTPFYRNALFTAQFPALFPPGTDHISLLLDMWFDPTLVPDGISIRSLGSASTSGQSKYMLTRYLQERGDASIQSIQDLIDKSTFFYDIRPEANFSDHRASLVSTNTATVLSMANFFQNRFAYQVVVLQCMAKYDLDALVSSSGNVPAYILGQPVEPNLNGRGASVWNVLGQQGFPMLLVPAGWTTYVWDRVRDATAPGGTKLVGPVLARLPVSITLTGRPYDEATLYEIAAAYEKATGWRESPPDFGPLPGEP